MNDIDDNWSNFIDNMEIVSSHLKKMTESQNYMRWQFEQFPEYREFILQMENAMNGWISSHC